MFNEDGLVKGAKRTGEEFMMADLDHPGWPRHLDRMLIHWDQDRWSDPKLLQEALRMPCKAVAGAQEGETTQAASPIIPPKAVNSFEKTEMAQIDTRP